MPLSYPIENESFFFTIDLFNAYVGHITLYLSASELTWSKDNEDVLHTT